MSSNKIIMAKFKLGLLKACVLGLVMACSAGPFLAQAEVRLDKLTACGDIARVYEYIKEKKPTSSRSCRPPRSTLDKELLRRSGLNSDQLCFDQSITAPFLEGFSCIWDYMKTGTALVCYRSIDEMDIKLYKKQYNEKTASAEKQYLSAAAACSASNGDSSDAQPTLAPRLISLISRFEFGFITRLGSGHPSDSAILHGYSLTDPDMGGNVPSGLEFISLFTGAPKYVSSWERKTAGNWFVNIDENKVFDEDFNKDTRKKRIPLIIDTTSYKLESRTVIYASKNEKLALTENLMRAIAKNLESEGFEAISDAQIQAESGMNSTEIIANITNNMPFGNRELAINSKFGSTIIYMFNERRPKCTKEKTGGAMAVYLASFQPIPEVTSDFGEVALIIAGLGECGRSYQTSTRAYVKGLIEESTDLLVSTLHTKVE